MNQANIPSVLPPRQLPSSNRPISQIEKNAYLFRFFKCERDALQLATRAENVDIAQYLHAVGSHRPYGRGTILQAVLAARALHSKVCLSRSCGIKLSTDTSPAFHKSPSAQFPPKAYAQAHYAKHKT